MDLQQPKIWLTSRLMLARPADAAEWSARLKWGDAVVGGQAGFHAVPDILVRGQSRLRLSSTEMVVILNLLVHWWRVDVLPHPRPSVIAKRMGVTTRTVERAISSLEEKGFVRRLEPENAGDKPAIRRFDLSGLVEAVQRLAEEGRRAATHPTSAFNTMEEVTTLDDEL